jgi:hypothetical protein
MSEQKEPNLIDKAKSLGKAVYNWGVNDKFAKVSPEIFEQRKSICLACPHWDQTAFNNLGKCKLCGCSVGKLYIPHQKCPDKPPRWESVVQTEMTPTPTPSPIPIP